MEPRDERLVHLATGDRRRQGAGAAAGEGAGAEGARADEGKGRLVPRRELGANRREEPERLLLARIHEILEELEGGVVAPVQVADGEDERRLRREGTEPLEEREPGSVARPDDIVGRPRRGRLGGGDQVREGFRVGERDGAGVDGGAERAAERGVRIRSVVEVGDAHDQPAREAEVRAADAGGGSDGDDARVGAAPGDATRLVEEPPFADAERPLDERHLGAVISDHGVIRLAQLRDLALAIEEGKRGGAGGGRATAQLEETG